MKILTFETTIKASASTVWETIINRASYEEWTGVAFPGSTFEGEWKTGGHMRFMGPDGSGTLVEFLEVIPEKSVRSVHRAMLLSDGKEDRESESAKSWIGTTENYTLTEENGVTHVLVEMKTNDEWIEMFEKSWPKSLEKLKELSEKKGLA